jgi:hypothetical protein
MARKCGGCGEIGHNKRTCPSLGNKPRAPRVPKGNRRCGKCGATGHNARTCKFSTRADAQGAVDITELDLNALAAHVHVSRPHEDHDLLIKNARVFECAPAYCRPFECELFYEVGDFVVVKYPWYEFVIVCRVTLINYETGIVTARNVDIDGPNAMWNFKSLPARVGTKIERFARDKKYQTKPAEKKDDGRKSDSQGDSILRGHEDAFVVAAL